MGDRVQLAWSRCIGEVRRNPLGDMLPIVLDLVVWLSRFVVPAQDVRVIGVRVPVTVHVQTRVSNDGPCGAYTAADHRLGQARIYVS